MINFFKWSSGARGQCISPVYAIKSSNFDKANFKSLGACKQAEFLAQNAKQITSWEFSGDRASSYLVYLVEEHYTINLNAPYQQEPTSRVEKSYLSYILTISGFVALAIIVVIIYRRKK